MLKGNLFFASAVDKRPREREKKMQIHSNHFRLRAKVIKINLTSRKKESCGWNEIRVLMLSSSYANHDDIPFFSPIPFTCYT